MEGAKFGRLQVLEACGKGKNRDTIWLCECQCGTVTKVRGANLKGGHTKSCGCLRHDTRPNYSHGMTNTPEYLAWTNMLRRCYDESNHAYHNYGHRGIEVCLDWQDSFEEFYTHVGPRPTAGHSLDRIDVNGSYEPGNVRWATAAEQRRNQRCYGY